MPTPAGRATLNLDFDTSGFWRPTEAEVAAIITDCPLAALPIAGQHVQHPIHPVQVVRDAYGLEAEQ